MLKNGIPFDYRERHPELFSEEAKRRMIDELDARSALENDINSNGVSGVAGSNESEAGRAARCRELPGRSRDAGQQWFRGDSPMTSAYLSDVGAAPSPLVYLQIHMQASLVNLHTMSALKAPPPLVLSSDVICETFLNKRFGWHDRKLAIVLDRAFQELALRI